MLKNIKLIVSILEFQFYGQSVPFFQSHPLWALCVRRRRTCRPSRTCARRTAPAVCAPPQCPPLALCPSEHHLFSASCLRERGVHAFCARLSSAAATIRRAILKFYPCGVWSGGRSDCKLLTDFPLKCRKSTFMSRAIDAHSCLSPCGAAGN